MNEILALQAIEETSAPGPEVGVTHAGSMISHYGTCSSACQCP